MICSKCGAECNDNLAFCLECGNPLQLMADFNLIEKELANNIGAFMDELDNEQQEEFEIEDDMKTIDMPLDEIDMELKIVDINRGTSKVENIQDTDILFEEDDEDEQDIAPVYTPRKRPNRKKKKNNKKIFILIGALVTVAIAILVAVLVIFGKGNNKAKEVTKDFKYYYELAEENLNKSNLDDASNNVLQALEKAKSDEDILKARLLMKSIYEEQKYTGDFYMENLEKLYELGEDSQENASILLKYYANKKNAVGLLNMFDLVSEEVARECLGEQFIEKPEVSLPSGEYKNVINVDIKADKNSTIYYAIYKSGEEVRYEEYTRTIEVLDLGDFTLSTYSVDINGMISYKAVCNYKIVEGEMTGPTVTPAAGTYKEPTVITVEVPKGGKVYYTYDGTEPTKDSTLYKEPVEMLKGVHTFKAISVDKYGNVSDVTSVQYNFKLTRNETPSTAKEKLWNHYFNNGLIDVDGNMADGSKLSVEYVNAAEIDNDEYYVFLVTVTLTDEVSGTDTSSITYCGVNTYDGTVYLGLIEDGDNFLLPAEQ